jgi:hypothetical protein
MSSNPEHKIPETYSWELPDRPERRGPLAPGPSFRGCRLRITHLPDGRLMVETHRTAWANPDGALVYNAGSEVMVLDEWFDLDLYIDASYNTTTGAGLMTRDEFAVWMTKEQSK